MHPVVRMSRNALLGCLGHIMAKPLDELALPPEVVFDSDFEVTYKGVMRLTFDLPTMSIVISAVKTTDVENNSDPSNVSTKKDEN